MFAFGCLAIGAALLIAATILKAINGFLAFDPPYLSELSNDQQRLAYQNFLAAVLFAFDPLRSG